MSQVDPVLNALADPTRRQIVEMLSGGEPMTMNDIADGFHMSRQAVAKHLTVLRDANVINGKQQGREHVHVLAPETLHTLVEWVDHYSQFWDSKLATLKSLGEKDHHNDRS